MTAVKGSITLTRCCQSVDVAILVVLYYVCVTLRTTLFAPTSPVLRVVFVFLNLTLLMERQGEIENSLCELGRVEVAEFEVDVAVVVGVVAVGLLVVVVVAVGVAVVAVNIFVVFVVLIVV